jgi:2-oxoglutarate ferredoxin oxidoreductase subunit beta
MINWFKDNTTSIGSKAKQENPELIERGVFEDREAPEYCDAYEQLMAQVQKGGR